jgi:hypothetical protein
MVAFGLEQIKAVGEVIEFHNSRSFLGVRAKGHQSQDNSILGILSDERHSERGIDVSCFKKEFGAAVYSYYCGTRSRIAVTREISE